LKRSKSKRRPWYRRVLRGLLVLAVAWLLSTTALVGLLRFVDPPMSAFMAQRMVEARLRGETGFQLHQQWQPLASISPHLQLAVIAAEDQKFLVHNGFDLDALRQVAREHLAGEGRRGGSTISQQTAKNLFLWPRSSWWRKGFETWFTGLLELLWPKERILEVYLNFAQFGRDIYGAEGAARAWFGKSAAGLSAEEAARLASVLPAPNRYRVQPPSAHVSERARWVQQQMRSLGGAAHLAPLHED